MSQETRENSGSGDRRPPLETDRGPVTADDLFSVLSEAPNRFVLCYLIEVDRPASTNELIEYAVMAVDAPPDETTGEFRGATRSAVERALPKLDSLGLLRYHERSGIVEPTSKTQVAEPYLALALEHLA